MKFRYIPALILSLLFTLSSSCPAGQLTFAPLPMEQKEKVLRQIAPMLRFVEQDLGSTITISYHSDYATILSDFQTGKIDLAFLGPLPYVELRQAYPEAEPVVRFLNGQGKDTYTCSIITGIESGLATLQPLKDKGIGLTQPHSTCGYLATAHLLEQAGLSIKQSKFRYTGSHQEVALTVIRGEFAGGGIKTSIGKKYAHLGLRFLAESKPLPGFLLVANGKTMSVSDIEKIRNSLLTLKPLTNEKHRVLTRGWGKNVRNGATTVIDSDYDVIREWLQGITIPSQGNF
ncbi:MAG: PhnD/SsuA/transferrin family substrate-binding protein [Thermodesulfobacteriota bacterium]